jgi:Tol biopolymer transport system component
MRFARPVVIAKGSAAAVARQRSRRLTCRVAVGAFVVAVTAAGCGGSDRSDRESPDAAAASQSAKLGLPSGRIAFRRYLDAGKTHGAVFTVETDGSGDKQITNPPAGTIDDMPDWSPDGRRIAFQRCADGPGCRVFTVAADGSDEQEVTAHCQLSEQCDLSSPAWTPDGRLVVTLAEGRERPDPASLDPWIEVSRLELLDLERHTQRTLIRRDHWTGGAETPAVSPDGEDVLYTRSNSSQSKPSFGRALFVVSIDGKHDHRITPWKLGGGDHPGFAPGGTILFRSYEEDESKQSDFWTVRPDGTDLRRLTHFEPGTIVVSASYSSDGKWIVHATNGVDDNADIFIMRADGSGNRPVTRTKLWDSAPDWGPPSS